MGTFVLSLVSKVLLHLCCILNNNTLVGAKRVRVKFEYSEEHTKFENMYDITNNLFVTSKNETMNSPIHEFKVLQNVF